VASYRHEVADGNFDSACERLARAPHSCAERMEEARHRLDEDAIERLQEAEVSDVRIRGDTATARADEETFDLRRIDGEWRVE